MSKRSKEAAFKAYPFIDGEMSKTQNSNAGRMYARNIFKKGYEQAERDLELTNEDVYDIWRIYNEVCAEGKILGFDETSQEVLKRYKANKNVEQEV